MSILGAILLWVALFVGWLSGLWMMVLGFQRHWIWGVALVLPQFPPFLFLYALFQGILPPQPIFTSLAIVGAVVYLCFLVASWPETKQPFFWGLTAVGLLVLFVATISASESPMSSMVARVLRAADLEQPQLERVERLFSGLRQFHEPGPATVAAPGRGNPRLARQQTALEATPVPVFRSHLPPPRGAPGEREPAQPGIYYLLERVTTKTAKGVQAGLPGERVILLERLPGQKMRVTVGNADFDVLASQLTDDLRVAREVEKQDFLARGGQL